MSLSSINKKILSVLCLLSLLCLSQPLLPVAKTSFSLSPTEDKDTVSSTSNPPTLYALSACLMDGKTGRVLYEKDGTTARAMASTTKIMTLIVALENASLDTVVTASALAASQPDVQLNMAEGEQFYLKDLLYSLMLESHNDSAYAIAETVAGSVENFAQLMNKKAQELSCEDTYFITPNGLDAENEEGVHHTTAADLARIMSYCVTSSPQKELFHEITTTPSYSFSDLTNTKSYSCSNHNALLTMVDGVIAGKTGFTGDAGYCYVCAVESEGRLFVISLLGCGWPNHKGYKWKDTKALLQYAATNYQEQNILEQFSFQETLTVKHAQGSASHPFTYSQEIPLYLPENNYTVLLRKEETLTEEISLLPAPLAPIKKGTKVGSYRILCGEELLCDMPILTASEVLSYSYSFLLKQVFFHFLF